MDGYRLDLSSPPDWRPLEQLSELCRSHRAHGPYPDEFTYAGRLVSDQLPTAHLYKHVRSREYLTIDVCAHVYRVRIGRQTIDLELMPLDVELARVHRKSNDDGRKHPDSADRVGSDGYSAP